jgi:apolipoprotein N-acyltransferase
MHKLSNQSWMFLNLLAGTLLALSFAPFAYSYLAIISLALLFCSWQQCSALQAMIRGYCYGLGMFGLGVTWVFVSIYFYGNASIFASLLLSSLFAAFWAVFPALAGYLSVTLAKYAKPALLLWIAPVIWILLEYGRGYWLLNGFPWLQIAYSQVDSVYAGFLPLVGVYGTGLLLAVSAAVLAELIYFKRHFGVGTATVLLLIVSGCGLKHIHWTETAGNPIKVALIQGNIDQGEKWQEDRLVKTLFTYQQMTYMHWDADVIIWPETSIPAYLSQVDEHFLMPLEQQAQAHNADVIVSLLDRDSKTNAVFNAALVLGEQRSFYRKNHLLPFGEYMPLQPLSGWVLHNIGMRLDDFSSGGNNQPLLKAGGYQFTTSICYEDAFGSEAIAQLAQTRYLVNLTNDAWFGHSLEPYQHLQMARARAIETGRYLLRATNTGVTAIIAPNGKVIRQAPLFETATVTGEIIPMQGITPYAKLGDKVIILFLAMYLATVLGIGKQVING